MLTMKNDYLFTKIKSSEKWISHLLASRLIQRSFACADFDILLTVIIITQTKAFRMYVASLLFTWRTIKPIEIFVVSIDISIVHWMQGSDHQWHQLDRSGQTSIFVNAWLPKSYMSTRKTSKRNLHFNI